MFPVLALIKKKPSLSRDAFRSYYESNHAPLALPLLDGIDRYVRYHVDEDLLGEVGFDVVTALWYRDEQAAERLFARLDGPEGRPIRADELRFMDKPANRFFAVREHDDPEGEEGDRSTFVFARSPADVDRRDALREIDAHWRRLFAEPWASGFARVREGFGMAGREPPFEGVAQLGGGVDAERLAKACEPLVRAGWEIVAVRTTRHETDLSRRPGEPVDPAKLSR